MCSNCANFVFNWVFIDILISEVFFLGGVRVLKCYRACLLLLRYIFVFFEILVSIRSLVFLSHPGWYFFFIPIALHSLFWIDNPMDCRSLEFDVPFSKKVQSETDSVITRYYCLRGHA
jgi:hypothetical protein